METSRRGIYVPSQSDRRNNTGVIEDVQFMSDQLMYDDILSEGKRNNDNNNGDCEYDRLNG